MRNIKKPSFLVIVGIISLITIVVAIQSVRSIVYLIQTTPESKQVDPHRIQEITDAQKLDIEKMKLDKADWEEKNPELDAKLKDPNSYAPQRSFTVPSLGNSRFQVEAECGAPDRTSSITTADGTARTYNYRSGPCKGIYGFDAKEKSVIIVE